MIVETNVKHASWKEVDFITDLPGELRMLEPIIYNLWWTWNPRAAEVFKSIHPELWERVGKNPIRLLKNLPADRVREILHDHRLLYSIEELVREFNHYMNMPIHRDAPSIAYFCMEYGLTHILQIYSGGLGILAGDYLKEFADSKMPLTAVGLLYRYGYFRQTLDPAGNQVANYDAQDFSALPLTPLRKEDGSQVLLEIPFLDHTLYSAIWQVRIGHINLYLLDTDVEQNSPEDRKITHELYGGDRETRIEQEYLLGIGGVRLLSKLGVRADVYHLNEGHGAFVNIQRLVQLIGEGHLSFDAALEVVRASSLYTVHTPVPAGHDYFECDLVERYFGAYPAQLGISPQEFLDLGHQDRGGRDKFSMSILALKTCREANGVALLHGRISQEMFAPLWGGGFFPEELPVGYVTNGVHLPTWAHYRWQRFFARTFGDNYIDKQDSEGLWSKIQALPDEALWAVRRQLKHELTDHIRTQLLGNMVAGGMDPAAVTQAVKQLDPNALFVGFSRRFATYKRAHLLFSDTERLARIVNDPEHPVRFILAGKAHPADGGGQGLIKHITEISRRPEFLGKIIFLPNYDIELAHKLIPGVDVWLNTPTRLMEASGTSGMKAELNGVLNLSVMDGWWYEGYVPDAGWAITEKKTYHNNQELQDKLDAVTLYDLLETRVIPAFFEEGIGELSHTWVKYIKNSLNFIAPHFTTRRMIKDYYARFYNKLAGRSALLQEDHYKPVQDIVQWKESVAASWDAVQVLDLSVRDDNPAEVGFRGEVEVSLSLDCGALEADVTAELVILREEADGNFRFAQALRLEEAPNREGNRRTFTLRVAPGEAGRHRVNLRIRPVHPLLDYTTDFAYVRWIALP